VLEPFCEGARSVTDLDILAFRFADAGHEVIRGRRRHGPLGNRAFAPDPVLGSPPGRPDMIVGEVKEGAAHFNPAIRNAVVLEVALARFGCCAREHARELTQQLLARGRVDTPAGHLIRIVAFGAGPDTTAGGRATIVPMRHVVDFLRSYLREHWDVLSHAQIKDPTLGILALLEKSSPIDEQRAGHSATAERKA
jgi:hypothetical protein